MKNNYPSADAALRPRDPKSGEALPARMQPGYYAGYHTLAQSAFWDEATRAVVEERVEKPPQREFFSEDAWDFWTAVFGHLIPQTDRVPERQVPIVAVLDRRLARNETVGYRYEDMPQDRVVYTIGIEAIEAEAEHRYSGKFRLLPYRQGDLVLKAIHDGEPQAAAGIWKRMSVHRFWQMLMSDAIDAYYAHPWAWDEIGFGGPAYPRAYTRLERGEPEPWEVKETRYEWIAPASAVSHEFDTSPNRHQSHHGSGGTH